MSIPLNEKNRLMEIEHNNDGTSHWLVNYKVPVAGIFVVLAQIFTLIWWGSGLSYTVMEHEKRIGYLEVDIHELQDANYTTAVKLARVEEKLDAQNITLQRIENGVLYNNKVSELLGTSTKIKKE